MCSGDLSSRSDNPGPRLSKRIGASPIVKSIISSQSVLQFHGSFLTHLCASPVHKPSLKICCSSTSGLYFTTSSLLPNSLDFFPSQVVRCESAYSILFDICVSVLPSIASSIHNDHSFYWS